MSSSSLTLAEIERLARRAQDIPQLAFSIANDPWGLLRYRQALVLRNRAGRWSAQAVSGLVEIGATTPYQNWLRRVAAYLASAAGAAPDTVFVLNGDAQAGDLLLKLTPEQLPQALAQDWSQWWPAEVIYVWLPARNGGMTGMAIFLFDTPATTVGLVSLSHLAEVWQHAWSWLSGPVRKAWIPGARMRWVMIAIAVAALLLPVRQSVLAPAEIISLESMVVASPVEGVVREVLVRPNQAVITAQPLVALDDTTLRNRRDVLAKSLGSAQAELLATTQKSFENMQSRGEIAPLLGRVEERRAELAYLNEQLQRTQITSPRSGIAVFGDPNEWRGRPVAAGERVMLIADPDQPGVLVHVPVADAIAIDAGAPMRVFLHVAPLSPLDGEVIETGYQALLSPENIASYRIRAKFTANSQEVRIGLKGTAKLYGPRVALGYLLLRRPLAAAREWVGL